MGKICKAFHRLPLRSGDLCPGAGGPRYCARTGDRDRSGLDLPLTGLEPRRCSLWVSGDRLKRLRSPDERDDERDLAEDPRRRFRTSFDDERWSLTSSFELVLTSSIFSTAWTTWAFFFNGSTFFGDFDRLVLSDFSVLELFGFVGSNFLSLAACDVVRADDAFEPASVGGAVVTGSFGFKFFFFSFFGLSTEIVFFLFGTGFPSASSATSFLPDFSSFESAD